MTRHERAVGSTGPRDAGPEDVERHRQECSAGRTVRVETPVPVGEVHPCGVIEERVDDARVLLRESARQREVAPLVGRGDGIVRPVVGGAQ